MFPAPVYVESRKKSVATAASQNHRAQKRDERCDETAALTKLLIHSALDRLSKTRWFRQRSSPGNYPPSDIGRIIREHNDTRTLNRGQAEKDAHVVRFQKIAEQPECKVAHHEEPEQVAFRVRLPRAAPEKHSKCQRKQYFVELRGMARNTVTEVNSPRQARPDASGVVVGTREKTTDASDGDADAQGNCEEVAGATSDAEMKLHQFDEK